MGQYHRLVNLDKQEWVDPHGLGLGSKQYEHTGAFDGSLADAIYLLVMSSPARGGGDWPETDASGRWAGDRVVVLGDYTQDNEVKGIENVREFYKKMDSDFIDITNEVRNGFKKVFNLQYKSKPATWDPTYIVWEVKDSEVI